MRTIAYVTLHAALAAALIALAASSAAATDTLKLLATVNMGATDANRGKEKWIEIQGWDWGRTAKVDGFAVKQGTARAGKKSGAVDYGWTVQAGEPASPPPDSTAKFGAVSGAHRDSSLDQAPQPTEKRQHDWRPSPMALERGAVRVKVKIPWVDCRVGARFPAAVLESANGLHEMTDVTIASCGPDAIALNYAKVKVRGWDPMEKKEIVGSVR